MVLERVLPNHPPQSTMSFVVRGRSDGVDNAEGTVADAIADAATKQHKLKQDEQTLCMSVSVFTTKEVASRRPTLPLHAHMGSAVEQQEVTLPNGMIVAMPTWGALLGPDDEPVRMGPYSVDNREQGGYPARVGRYRLDDEENGRYILEDPSLAEKVLVTQEHLRWERKVVEEGDIVDLFSVVSADDRLDFTVVFSGDVMEDDKLGANVRFEPDHPNGQLDVCRRYFFCDAHYAEDSLVRKILAHAAAKWSHVKSGDKGSLGINSDLRSRFPLSNHPTPLKSVFIRLEDVSHETVLEWIYRYVCRDMGGFAFWDVDNLIMIYYPVAAYFVHHVEDFDFASNPDGVASRIAFELASTCDDLMMVEWAVVRAVERGLDWKTMYTHAQSGRS